MDGREQRVVLKILWLQKHGIEVIHVHLRGTLGATAVSLPTVKRRVRHFSEGDTSCEHKLRLGRPLIILGDVLSKFLLKYPFACAEIIAKYFDVSGSTVKNPFIREPGRRKFTRRWVPNRYRRLRKENEQPNPIIIGLTASISRSWLQSNRDREQVLALLCVPGLCLHDLRIKSLLASEAGSVPQTLWSLSFSRETRCWY